jgi:hypothetical protein
MSQNKKSQYQQFVDLCQTKVQNFQQFHDVLFKFVLNKKGQRIGVVVSFQSCGEIYVGCSKCNRRDKFNKWIGLNYAIERACIATWSDVQCSIPFACVQPVVDMHDRAQRYFKNAA